MSDRLWKKHLRFSVKPVDTDVVCKFNLKMLKSAEATRSGEVICVLGWMVVLINGAKHTALKEQGHIRPSFWI